MATLGNPKNTIEIIQKYGFNFQKKFGQNFLIDTRVLERIIEESGIDLPVSHFETALSVIFSFSASCIWVRFTSLLHSAINFPILT